MTRAANDATLQKAGDIYHQSDSPFHSWNNIKKTEKLKRLKDIGAISKKNEETFRNHIIEFSVTLMTKVSFWKY